MVEPFDQRATQSPPDRSAIGIDVGGTKCAAGLVVLPAGRVLASRLQPTRPERGGEAVLVDMIAIARSLQDEALRLDREVTAVGVGVAELVSPHGHVLSDATIRWKGLAVGERLGDATQLPVIVDADVRAAARGEAHLGAGRQFGSFLYITVGTGISSSIVIDKMPYAGARGLTGTFASSPSLIPGDDGAIISGLPLEQFAAGPALAARLAAERAGFAGAAPDVLALADSGDAAAQAIVGSAGQALGAAIAQLVNVLDPEAVVIGGGLGLAPGLYQKSFEESLRAHVWSEYHRDIPLLSAQLGVDAGVVGAALGAMSMEES